MKVLVLNGSAKKKKSRSYKLACAFIEGLKENESFGDMSIDDYFLSEKKISECKECYYCWSSENGKCIIDDDMTELIEKYIAADLVIWSFPLIFFGFPCSLKKFIDRLLPLYSAIVGKLQDDWYVHLHRYEKVNERREVFISTCGFPAKTHNYESIDEYLNIMFYGRTDKIFCSEGSLFNEERFKKLVDRYIYAVKMAGKRYSLENGLDKKSIEQLDKQIIMPDLYIEESNKNILWLSRNDKAPL